MSDIHEQFFILNATYKNGQRTVSFKVDDITIRQGTELGTYRVRCVFYRNASYTTYTTEDRLMTVFDDFAAGRIASMDFVCYEQMRSCRVVETPYFDITSDAIIINCLCVLFPSERPRAFYKPEKPNAGLPNIIEVIFNNPATIVYWSDGTKTVVKACDMDAFDKETGFAMAIAKKMLSYKCIHPRSRFKHIVESAKDYSDKQ